MSVLSYGELKDKAVVTKDGHVIGSVETVVIDTDLWRIERLGVKVRREAVEALGLKKPWIRRPEIEIPVREIAGVSDAVVLYHRAADLDFEGGDAVLA